MAERACRRIRLYILVPTSKSGKWLGSGWEVDGKWLGSFFFSCYPTRSKYSSARGTPRPLILSTHGDNGPAIESIATAHPSIAYRTRRLASYFAGVISPVQAVHSSSRTKGERQRGSRGGKVQTQAPCEMVTFTRIAVYEPSHDGVSHLQ